MSEDELLVTYRAMRATKALSGHRAVVYRCPSRCLLLDVITTPPPVGTFWHQPRYTLSPGLNASRSSAEGRAANTEDGKDKWKARAYAPEVALNASLNCDHLPGVCLSRERIERDTRARAGEVVVTQGDHEPPPAAGSVHWGE